MPFFIMPPYSIYWLARKIIHFPVTTQVHAETKNTASMRGNAID